MTIHMGRGEGGGCRKNGMTKGGGEVSKVIGTGIHDQLYLGGGFDIVTKLYICINSL